MNKEYIKAPDKWSRIAVTYKLEKDGVKDYVTVTLQFTRPIKQEDMSCRLWTIMCKAGYIIMDIDSWFSYDTFSEEEVNKWFAHLIINGELEHDYHDENANPLYEVSLKDVKVLRTGKIMEA